MYSVLNEHTGAVDEKVMLNNMKYENKVNSIFDLLKHEVVNAGNYIKKLKNINLQKQEVLTSVDFYDQF